MDYGLINRDETNTYTLKVWIREEALDYVNTTYDYGSNDSTYGFRNVQYNKTYSNEEDNRYSTSNVKSYVDKWYEAILEPDYSDKIKENIYCSDRYEPDEPSQIKTTYYPS